MRFLNSFMERGQTAGYIYLCPGCKMGHALYVLADRKHPDRPIWTFDGNMVAPTFYPSVLLMWQFNGENKVCHHHVIDGMLQFLPDCTHHLAGKTVPMILRDD